MKKYFKLYACCIPVKGHKRSTICDLQRNDYDFIPNDLFNILDTELDSPIEELFEKYDSSKEAVAEYFSFLISREYGFYTDTPELFPPVQFEWERPSAITNAIIDFDRESNHNLLKISNELTILGCEYLELRFYSPISISTLFTAVSQFDTSSIRSINLILPYTDFFNKDVLENFIHKFSRIRSLIFHSYKGPHSIININNIEILYTSELIENELCCGNVSASYFVSNISIFTESQNFNNCLNKKIAIDKRGEIKNCPSLLQSFGFHKEKSLLEVVSDSKFRRIWKIKKEQVEVCRDCEFRFICQDCRAYILTPENIFSKPIKCNYNPYEAIWC